MAATKKNTKKKTTGSRKKKSNQYEMDEALTNELLIILVFAICALLFLCNIGLIGSVGNIVSAVFFGIFGWLGYIMPIVLLGIFAFGIINRANIVAKVRIVCIVIIFLSIGVLIELWGGDVSNLGTYDIKSFYSNGSMNHSGGGVIAGSLSYLMYHYLDKAGTVLISIVLILICLIIITGKSFLKALKNGSMKMYDVAREDVRQYREQVFVKRDEEDGHDDREAEAKIRRNRKAPSAFDELKKKEEKIEEVPELGPEKIPRRDRKASGVYIDTIAPVQKKSSMERDDIHEITVNDITDIATEKAVAVSKRPFDDLAEIKFHGNDEADEKVSNTVPEKNDFSDMNEVKFNTSSAGKQTDVYDSSEAGISATGNLAQSISINKQKPRKKYRMPTIELLNKPDAKVSGSSKDELLETARVLQDTLETFGVKAKVTDISQGPSVTRFELQPEIGVRVNKIVQLTDDIKLALAATDVRIEAPIPGKSAVGIEVPNKVASAVGFRELLESKEFKNFDSKIAFAVGKDISGNTVVTDIAKMPHMLIAGATGSGKSVCINTIIMSILYKASPDDVKLIMIDPKVVELSVYNGIPHLLVPVVTDPKQASSALHWGVAEMTDRYKKFADHNVRDLKGYNAIAEEKLPQIVIIVDELADLMMVAAKEVEESICRLAQLARACGIHLIIATQRPSVDVITGLIKANMPSRVAFAVSSGVDSRTILDMNGAEKLLGKGDMLFYPQGYPKPARMQGAFISDAEVSRVVNFIKDQNVEYTDFHQVEMQEVMTSMQSGASGASVGTSSDNESDFDELASMAGRFIIESDKASIGALQRKFKIGFNRAARIMDQLCELGVVSEEQGTKPRTILMGPEQFEQIVEEYL